ncbi:hypothetical protein ANANG_G00246580 [Anguilla anguilla]|uniref:Uncharacterized protein n=1 Tax=Anguilla anguilla TaxID=7936 RepID=A0A9D3RMG3_ANGAN|nr:hypothetical protein ANANG_G00246580 [Anguilla anguilla]
MQSWRASAPMRKKPTFRHKTSWNWIGNSLNWQRYSSPTQHSAEAVGWPRKPAQAATHTLSLSLSLSHTHTYSYRQAHRSNLKNAKTSKGSDLRL